MFLIKPSTITVDFFTVVHATEGPTAPDMAMKFIPSWWKNLPKESTNQKPENNHANMRTCPGFVDYFKHSIMLPMWCDLALTVSGEDNAGYQYQFADRMSTAEVHPDAQKGEYLPSQKYQHLKLINPWRAKTTQDVNWVFSQPTWCFDEPERVVVPTGMVNLKEQHDLHINIFIPRHATEMRDTFISAGQPMVALTPMSDKKVVIKRHKVSTQEMEALTTATMFFVGDAVRSRALRKAWSSEND